MGRFSGKVSSRTVLNRKALNAMTAGFVDGMEAMGEEFLDIVDPPDATPFGKGLVTTPDYGVWAYGRKVAGTASKPKRVKIKDGITLIAGEGFPGRFQEFGTVHHGAQPHVIPAMNRVIPGASAFIKPKVRERLARVR